MDEGWQMPDVIQQRNWINFDINARYDEPVRIREILTAKKVIAHS